ncbi:MAG: hypothetical protein ACLPVY_14390 [Acidimicrobiia bacterium]
MSRRSVEASPNAHTHALLVAPGSPADSTEAMRDGVLVVRGTFVIERIVLEWRLDRSSIDLRT